MSRGRRWALAVAILAGMALGLGFFTFGYAKGASYLTNDPAACANCHVMSEHYAAWLKGSHRTVATCNDCHTPHNLVGKYVVKARNGFWHSFYFTTGGYPDPLRITEGNREVTEETCRYCHAQITAAIDHGAPVVPPRGDGGADRRTDGGTDGGTDAAGANGQPSGAVQSALAGGGTSCIRCHQYVGHWVR